MLFLSWGFLFSPCILDLEGLRIDYATGVKYCTLSADDAKDEARKLLEPALSSENEVIEAANALHAKQKVAQRELLSLARFLVVRRFAYPLGYEELTRVVKSMIRERYEKTWDIRQ